MANFDINRFNTAKNDWETPDDLFKELDKEFNFTLDVAASEENKKCLSYISKEQNGLLSDWGNNICWLNPPYGEKTNKLSDWVKKAYEESLKGSTVVMLIPARTNTNWFHDYCLKGEVRFIKGRPKFKGAKYGLPQPLILVIFRPEY